MQKRLVSLINCAGKKLDSYMQKSETNTCLYHMNKLKWVKDLNVRPETIKLLEENTVWFLTSVLIIFLNLSPQVRATKAKINK